MRFHAVSYTHKPAEVTVFKSFNLELALQEITAIVGPNGCGKTTLLNLAADIYTPQSGECRLAGKAAGHARVGFVFQNYRLSLLPWLSARDNIALVLPVSRGMDDRRRRVDDLCAEFGCTINLDNYPYQLSGGQQQLIAIMRCFIIEPDLLLLDEPFSALDTITRVRLLERFARMWMSRKVTTMFVTHDIEEALLVGSRIIVLGGRPARVAGDYRNELQYPRTPATTVLPDFMQRKKKIVDLIYSLNSLTV